MEKEIDELAESLKREQGFTYNNIIRIGKIESRLNEMESKVKRNHTFLVLEMALLWIFEILTCIGYLKLRG